jgi:hypothetical protein
MPDAPQQVTGRFATPAAARDAMSRLEAAGFDGEAVTLAGLTDTVSTKQSANDADLDATGDVAKGAAAGSGIGATAAAIVGGVTGAVLGGPPGAVAGAAAGGVAGAALGGFYGGAEKLSVNEDSWVTYELQPDAEHPIEVVVRVTSRDDAERARATLAGTTGGGDAPGAGSGTTLS